MESGALTAILTSFKDTFTQGVTAIIPYAMGLMISLATIEAIISHGMALLGAAENHFEILFRNLLRTGFFVLFVKGYTEYLGIILNSFVQVGGIIGGSQISAAVATDPSFIYGLGFNLMQATYSFAGFADQGPIEGAIGAAMPVIPAVLAVAKGELTVAKLLPNLFFFAVSLAIWLTFLVLALQMFVTFLEFYVVGALLPILLPWGVNRYTSFIAEKAFGLIVATGVKVAVLIAILNATIPHIKTWSMPQDPTNAQCLQLLGGAIAITFLACRAPSMAASVMAGGPSLTMGSIAAAASTTVGMLRTVISGGRLGGGGSGGGGASNAYRSAQYTANSQHPVDG